MSDAHARPRQRSVHCPAKAQAFIRGRARAAGESVSHYVLELARADDPDVPEAADGADARRALRESMRSVEETLRALRAPLPECGGLTLFDAIALLARARGR